MFIPTFWQILYRVVKVYSDVLADLTPCSEGLADVLADLTQCTEGLFGRFGSFYAV
jgi:hypothetical protein